MPDRLVSPRLGSEMPRPRLLRSTSERFVATVLFTDLAESTELATELGDHRWKQVLAMHHALIRAALKRHHGRELDTAGDGFFAMFNQPANAVRCASEIADALWTRGLRIRAGVHVGEVERDGSKVGGLAVHIGARIMSGAQVGEVRVSSTVRDLVVGSDLAFADRGLHTLKGVPGEWRLFAVVRSGAPEGLPSEPPPALEDVSVSAGTPWHRNPALLVPTAIALVAAAVAAYLFVGSDAEVTPSPDTVAKLDPATNTFVASVPVGQAPSYLAYGDGSLWILSPARQTMTRVDTAAAKNVDTVSVGGTPTGIAYGEGAVWVAAGFGLTSGEGASVLRFDSRTTEAPTITQVGGDIHSIAFGYGSIWTTSKNRNTVTRIDAGTRSVAGEIPVGEGPEGVAVGAGAVWVANSLDNTVTRIDPQTDQARTIPLLVSPNVVAATENAVWVASRQSNAIVRIDPGEGGASIIELEASPSALAATPDEVWVVAPEARGILRLDARTRKVDRPLPVQGRPTGIALAGDAVWLTIA